MSQTNNLIPLRAVSDNEDSHSEKQTQSELSKEDQDVLVRYFQLLLQWDQESQKEVIS